ncbi:MAG: OmpA family protein [Sarcina sp.]
MARKRRKKSTEAERKTGGWLASFADTMTLLMTFFILLYSMASVEESKILSMANALQEILQGQKKDAIFNYDLENGEAPIVGGENQLELELPVDEEDYTYEELKKYIEGNNLESLMDVNKTERGVELQLSDSILFPSAKAILREESKVVLGKVAEVAINTKTDIIIEGHTDNRPISNGQFESNWELSTQRAVNVVKYFISDKKVKPERLSAVGYGEYKPIASNDTENGRSSNRRVTILFKGNDTEGE